MCQIGENENLVLNHKDGAHICQWDGPFACKRSRSFWVPVQARRTLRSPRSESAGDSLKRAIVTSAFSLASRRVDICALRSFVGRRARKPFRPLLHPHGRLPFGPAANPTLRYTILQGGAYRQRRLVGIRGNQQGLSPEALDLRGRSEALDWTSTAIGGTIWKASPAPAIASSVVEVSY